MPSFIICGTSFATSMTILSTKAILVRGSCRKATDLGGAIYQCTRCGDKHCKPQSDENRQRMPDRNSVVAPYPVQQIFAASSQMLYSAANRLHRAVVLGAGIASGLPMKPRTRAFAHRPRKTKQTIVLLRKHCGNSHKKTKVEIQIRRSWAIHNGRLMACLGIRNQALRSLNNETAPGAPVKTYHHLRYQSHRRGCLIEIHIRRGSQQGRLCYRQRHISQYKPSVGNRPQCQRLSRGYDQNQIQVSHAPIPTFWAIQDFQAQVTLHHQYRPNRLPAILLRKWPLANHHPSARIPRTGRRRPSQPSLLLSHTSPMPLSRP